MKKLVIIYGMFISIIANGVVYAGGFSVEYIKTIGQNNNNEGAIPTLGGRISIDEAGQIYCGTPAGGSSLINISPEGRVIWNTFQNVPGFQGTAVDNQYLYTCGSGYYGYRQVQRWNKRSGKKAEGWQHQWIKDELSDGVRSMGMPVAMAVDDKYLYVLDSKENELRRLDKTTGKEAAFSKRVMVYEPIDMVLSPEHNILILTKNSLLEVDSDGKPLRIPLVYDLQNAVSVDINPLDKNIYIAVGGSESDLVNRILIFDKNGKSTDKKIGIGGDFQGKWSPESFAFSSGTGDITFDQLGGLWVNPGWYGKLMAVRVLSYFDVNGKYKKSIKSISNYRGMVAVDEELNIYPEGKVKLSQESNIIWTSGLIYSGDTKNYPYINSNWPLIPSFIDNKIVLFSPADGGMTALYAETGKYTGNTYKYQRNGILFYNSKNIFILKNNVIYSIDSDFENEQKIFSLPDIAEETLEAADIDNDMKYIYCLYKKGKSNSIRCYSIADGKLCWDKPSGIGIVVCGGFLVTSVPSSAFGKRVINAKTGETLQDIDSKNATTSRSPVSNGMHWVYRPCSKQK
jgi:DNA-binding beta-propeller fold protein YncE